MKSNGSGRMRSVAGACIGVWMCSAAAAWGASGTLAQENYRWRNDDGSESAAAWKAAANTAITGVQRGQNIRLRFSIRETGGSYAASVAGSLQYAMSESGPWTTLGTNDLAAFKMAPTSRYATGDATTAQLGSGTFVAGKCVEGPDVATPSTSIAAANYSNFEYCFQATAKAQGSTTYYFQLGGMYSYTRNAQLTMAAGETEEPPEIATPLTASASTEAPFAYTVQATGSEPMTYGASGLPAGLTFDGTNTIRGTATAEGTFNVSLTASNAYGTDTETLTLTVVGNLPPVASNQSMSLLEGAENLIYLAWSDADTPALTNHTFTILSGPSNGTIESYNHRNNTTVYPDRYYYRAGAGSADSFTWKCSDGKDDSNTATVSITFTPNTPPVAKDQSIDILAGAPATMLKLDRTDPDSGQAFTYTLVSAPAHGALEYYYSGAYKPVPVGTPIATYLWYYTSDGHYEGADPFEWRCSDGIANSGTATYTINVLNSGPTAADCSAVAGTDRTTRIRAAYTDPDTSSGSMQLGVVAPPAHGTLETSAANFYYTPAPGYTGADTFQWWITDGIATSETASCSVTVTDTPPGGDNTVILLVKSSLLPEITNEVCRLKQDLEWEHRTVKITPWSGTSSYGMWQYLTNEYHTAGQTLEGAILIGTLPFAKSDYISDIYYWNMTTWLNYQQRDIWVSRMHTTDKNGGKLSEGTEVDLLKRVLQQNHDYRTGASRYRHAAYQYTQSCFHSDSYYTTTKNALVAWIEASYVKDNILSAWTKSGELFSGICHGPNGITQIMINPLKGYPAQGRFVSMCSCNGAHPGGPAHKAFFNRGGVIFSTSSTKTIGGGYMAFSSKPLLDCLAKGKTWGQALRENAIDYNSDATLVYGDLSMPIMMSPANRVPALQSFSADVTSGRAPLTVNLSVSASDPDGVVGACEWYCEGYAQGRATPTDIETVGTPTFNRTRAHTFNLPHRYQTGVVVLDEHKAAAWSNPSGKPCTIVVKPALGQVLRVNCGRCSWFSDYYVKGLDYSDTEERLWLYDQPYGSDGTWGYSGASAVYVGQEVSGTDDDSLYRYFRKGATVTYCLPVGNGAYWVRLKLADMESTAAGQTVMDVDLEGTTRLSGLDVYATAGAKTAFTTEMYTEVTDGVLVLTVKKNAASTKDAFLNAFEVVPYTDGNRPPLAENQCVSTPRDVLIAVVLEATDPDNDTMTYAVVDPPSHGALSGTAPNLTYTPDPGYAGLDQFTFTANDGQMDGNVGVVYVSVTAPAAHWKLDETGGTNALDSVAGNDGALVNGPAWGAGRIGGGLSFDGVDDKVSISTAPYANIMNTFTMTAWVNPTASRKVTDERTDRWETGNSGQRYAVYPTHGTSAYGSGHAGSGISVGTNGVSVTEHADSYMPTILVSKTPVTGWTHVAVVYRNKTPSLYLDGVWVRTGLRSPQIVHPGCSMGGSSAGWYQGGLDDVRIYYGALTDTQIAELAANGPVAPRITSDLAATAEAGQPFTYTITAVGTAPLTFGATGLPAGLTFDGTNRISGAPTTAGTNDVTLTASNSQGTDTETLVLAVVTPPDFDLDGIPDGNDPDDDNDGMPDDWEATHEFDTKNAGDANQDTDGDGMTNLEEYVAGTNPRDAGSRFQCSGFSVSAEGGPASGWQVTLRFLTETGRLYGVQGRGEMAGTSQWVEVTNGIPGTGGYLEVRDPVTGARRFYRIKVRME